MPLLTINGIELHYHLQGKGVPIVFVHPVTLGSRVFTYMRGDLSQDHRTLLFDIRGHGRSATSASKLTFPLVVEDMCRLMDALELPSAYLCAYETGALIALEALLAHPQRFRGAALLSGMAEPRGSLKWIDKAVMYASALRMQGLISWSNSWVHADNREAFYRLREEAGASDPAKWKEFIAYEMGYSVRERLPDIRQPVLLVFGEQDKYFAPQAGMMQAGLPNASVAWIPGVGRTLPMHAAGPCSKLIRDWIAASGGGAKEPGRIRARTPRRLEIAGAAPNAAPVPDAERQAGAEGGGREDEEARPE